MPNGPSAMRRIVALAVAGVLVMVGCAAASAGQAQPEQQWSVTNGAQTFTAIHLYSPDAYTLGFVVTLSGLTPGTILTDGNFDMGSQQISHYYCPGPGGTRLDGGSEFEGSLAEDGRTLGDGPFVANAHGVAKVTVFQSDVGVGEIFPPECPDGAIAYRFDFTNIQLAAWLPDDSILYLNIPGTFAAHGRCTPQYCPQG
jgi:hypothetical protein